MCEPIAEHDMAGIITYIAPVDYASGRIFGKKNKWTAVKRTFGNKQRGCAFGGQRNMLTHPVTEDEVAARNRFKTIATNVAKRRKKSSPTYEADTIAFLTQRDQAGGIDSFQKWLWMDEKGKIG